MIDRERLEGPESTGRKASDCGSAQPHGPARPSEALRRLASCGEWTHDQCPGAGKRVIPA
jgi:hypothetical protein